MTVESIFSELAAHMIEGLMVHSQMSDYYGFLGLKGYQECHKYHYFEENINFRKLSAYYLHHYNKIIPEIPFENPSVIPESWYKYNRQDVNASTRKNAIQTGMEKWISWEKETKELYQRMYKELIALNEIAGAEELAKYITDVDKELSAAAQKELELKAIDYDICLIIDKQEEKYKKYKHKLKELEF
jgi:hypothetical protein